MATRDFRKVVAWQKAHALVLEIYAATMEFPKTEQYSLTDQMRRAAVSIASNIAEGCGYATERAFARFLQISVGSASELEYQIILAKDLKYLLPQRANALESQTAEVKRVLYGLIQSPRIPYEELSANLPK